MTTVDALPPKYVRVCVLYSNRFVVVFLQGTFHLRTTLLPMEDVIEEQFVKRITDFHKGFMDKYRD